MSSADGLPPELARRLRELPPEKRAWLERKLRQSEFALDLKPSLTRRESPATAPLSFAQERLRFLWELEPESPAYNRPTFLRLTGRLDATALEQALNGLTRRHEVLRASYPIVGGRPVQSLRPGEPQPLPCKDLSGGPAESRKAELERLARVVAREPFDLSDGPVMRATLVRCEAEDHFLLLVFHHIAFDAWSGTVLLDELPQLYEAFHKSAPVRLAPLPIQYADFAAWQRECRDAGAWAADLSYWQEELGDQLPLLELPIAKPRPVVPRYDGESVSQELAPELVTDLRALCQRERVTMFMLLLAVFKVLLRRYTGQEDIIVGCPIAGRTQVETEGLIGCFVNTLALRSRVRGEMKFPDLLGQVRDTVLRAFEHQALPFEQVIEALNPARMQNCTPIFQIFFNYRNLPMPERAAAELQFAPWRCEDGIAQFDVSLDLTETGDRLSCRWIFDRDRFQRDGIQRLAGHYQTLLEHLVAEPDRRVSQASILTAAERDQMLVEWNAAATEYPKDPCIHELFEAQAERTPDAVAVVFEDQRLTYRELNGRANQLAHHLRSLGVGPEVLVGICLERSLEMVVGLLGILKAGGAYVPVDLAYPEARMRFVLDDSRAPVLLTQEKFRASLSACTAELVCLESAGAGISSRSTDNPVRTASASNAAYVIYTSGSTGEPKGAVVTHGNIVRLFKRTEHWFGFSASDVWTMFHSYAFDFSVWEMWGALLYGGRLVVVPNLVSRSPGEFYELLAREKVTVLNQTPSAFRQLIWAEACAQDQLGLNLRHVILGGEALALRSLKPWFERHGDEKPVVANMYGITETTVFVTYRRIREVDLTRTVGSVIGVPIPDLQVFLLDQDLQPVPVGVPGEICVGGAGLARGYLNRTALTNERFMTHPFSAEPGARLYRSGDLARYTADGELEYLGRTDHQVKIRGFRVELGEIEAALMRHPAVGEAVVLAREDAPGDQRLIAYLVPSPNASLPAIELREHLRTSLPDYMVPAAFVTLPAMPLTPNGKIDRRALPAVGGKSAVPDDSFVAPRTRTEEALAGIWREVLGVERVGLHDSFFDLGGHSLLAMRLIWEIQQHFGKVLPLAALFSAPTIAQFSRVLEESRPSVAARPSGCLRGAGAGAPFFYIPGAAGYEFLPEAIARRISTVRRFYDGLQYRGLDGQEPPRERVEDIAADLVAQIRRVWPPGPYCLCGYSLGGVVAFEVARQMEAQGLEVEKLLLLDTYCRGSLVPKRSLGELIAALRHRLATMDRRARVGWLARLAAAKLSIRFSITTEQIKTLRRFFKTTRPPAIPADRAAAVTRVEAAALRAARQYRPGPYAGRVTIFQVEFWDYAYLFKKRDPFSGWGSVARGDLQVITIPGVHELVLKEPNVSAVAEKIRTCLLGQGPPTRPAAR